MTSEREVFSIDLPVALKLDSSIAVACSKDEMVRTSDNLPVWR
jgi:hypothetical protein